MLLIVLLVHDLFAFRLFQDAWCSVFRIDLGGEGQKHRQCGDESTNHELGGGQFVYNDFRELSRKGWG